MKHYYSLDFPWWFDRKNFSAFFALSRDDQKWSGSTKIFQEAFEPKHWLIFGLLGLIKISFEVWMGFNQSMEQCGWLRLSWASEIKTDGTLQHGPILTQIKYCNPSAGQTHGWIYPIFAGLFQPNWFNFMQTKLFSPCLSSRYNYEIVLCLN